MKTIDTLIKDIKTLLVEGPKELTTNDNTFGRKFYDILERRWDSINSERVEQIWFSNIGHPCSRKLWYKLHIPDKAEPLGPSTRLKFLYGEFLEELVLELARLSGHSVEYEQEKVVWNEISGRIDAIIDGVLVDVKTASPRAFKKFKDGLTDQEDSFGYLGQLAGYLLALRETKPELLKEHNKAAFLAINKVNGDLHLDVHEFSDQDLYEWFVEFEERKIEATGEDPPERAFNLTPEGKAGNMKLGVNCSYCEFKKECWPGLRKFVYAGNRPVYLAKIIKEPNVREEPVYEGDF